MKTLLTCVGDTDPIRGFHDGAVLHIARVERPEKIIIIFSERSKTKQLELEKAINSIDETYNPEIVVHSEIIADDEVWLFDRVYSFISKAIQDYLNEEDEFLLNLSSGTPQMKSALFTFRVVSNHDIKALSVSTPMKSSNQELPHDHSEDIGELIDTNDDNQKDFINRIIVEEPESFNNSLISRSLKDLIKQYDYQGALSLIKDESTFPNRDKLVHKLKVAVNNINTQSLPDDFGKLSINNDAKKALHAFLILKIRMGQNNIPDSLIRIVALVESLLACYIKKRKPGIIIKEKGSKKGEYYLKVDLKNNNELAAYLNKYNDKENFNLYYGDKIIEFYNLDNNLSEEIQKIFKVKDLRNKIAHNLEAFDSNEQINVDRAYKATENILLTTFDKIKKKDLYYYDNFNKELLDLLID